MFNSVRKVTFVTQSQNSTVCLTALEQHFTVIEQWRMFNGTVK